MTDKPDGAWTWLLGRRNAILAILGAIASGGAYWFGIAKRAQAKNASIHADMTREQVEAILGEPNRVATLPGGQIACQYKGDGRTQLIVLFHQDSVFHIKIVEPKSPL
jgi:hypothetical protein